ncbi:MAG: hypothetical protein M3160_10830 [Candidatus Eremiobacteraeota bacterium]|nr:hypothetical protein [Candidatus Eremiobacteraeota bacterium]
MPTIAVGVDAGGSSTVAGLSHDGKLLRSASGAGASPSTLGPEAAAGIINDVLDQVLCGERPDAICIGAAGAGRSGVAVALAGLVGRRFEGAHVDVYDDAFVALRAAEVPTPAILLIAGTGSIAVADTGTQMERAGGFGYFLGDEGSGFSIGLAAAKLLAQCLDGRTTRDDFIAAIGKALDVSSPDELIERIYGNANRVTPIAGLAPIVLQFASSGNRRAHRIVQSAALELAELVRLVARKAALLSAQPTVVLSGGLLRENSILSFLLETRVQNDLAGAPIVRRPAEPYLGALHTAHAWLTTGAK